MIKCAICDAVFTNIITWKHLKKHNISTAEYKQTYGAVVSNEYRAMKSQQNSGSNNPNAGRAWTDEQKLKLSEKKQGSVAWNRGVAMSEQQKQLLSTLALERNQAWRETGSHPNLGRTHSEATRAKIRERRAAQIILPESVQKATETKRKRYGKLTPFLGRTHSDESKKRISESLLSQTSTRSQQAQKQRVELATSVSLEILDEDQLSVNMRCLECNNQFSITKQYFTDSKFTNQTFCRICNPISTHSKAELDLLNTLRSLNPNTEIICGNRKEIFPLELDIWIPEHRLAVEYCGLYWHSDERKDSNYHLNKLEQCQSKNIDLITVFEDEWVQKKDLVLNMIQHRIGNHVQRINAGECDIKEIQTQDCQDWLEDNHLAGAGQSQYKLGAYYQNALVAVMTFTSSESSKENQNAWEINRFAVQQGLSVPGVASWLFKRFCKEIDPITVISHCDRRWDSGKVYEKLGFANEGNTVPNCWYFTLQDITRKQQASQGNQGHLCIYDCGNSVWTWRRTDHQ